MTWILVVIVAVGGSSMKKDGGEFDSEAKCKRQGEIAAREAVNQYGGTAFFRCVVKEEQ